MQNVPTMTEPVAETSYDILLDPETGFFRDAALDLEGVETVLDLRRTYTGATDALTDPAQFYDQSYYEAAMD